jgi:hypothetical protein
MIGGETGRIPPMAAARRSSHGQAYDQLVNKALQGDSLD